MKNTLKSITCFFSKDHYLKTKIIARFGLLYSLVWGISQLLATPWLGVQIGAKFIEPQGFNTGPLQWLGLVLVLFLLIELGGYKTADLRWPTKKEWYWGLVLLIGTLILSAWITHFPNEYRLGLSHFIKTHPNYGGALMGSIICTALLLPFLPLSLLVLPSQMYRGRYYLLYLALEGLLFVSLIESLYHHIFNPILTKSVAWVSGLWAENVSYKLATNYLEVEGFSVIIGPSCSGIGSILLFLMLFGYVLYSLHRQQYRIRLWPFLFTFLIGGSIVIGLNILRISALMKIGVTDPEFAVGLFHSSAGGLLFFLFFLAFLPVVRHWVCQKIKNN